MAEGEVGNRPAVGNPPPGQPVLNRPFLPLANQPPAPFRPPDLPGPVFPGNQQKPQAFLPPQQDSVQAVFSPPPLPPGQVPPAMPAESGLKPSFVPFGAPQAFAPPPSGPALPKYEVPKPSFYEQGQLPPQAPKPFPPVFSQPAKAPQSDPWVGAKRPEEGKANVQFPPPTYQFNSTSSKPPQVPSAVVLTEPSLFTDIREKASLDASGNTWSCPKCTYQSTLDYIQCEMCQFVNEPLKKILEIIDKPGKMHEKSLIQGGKEAVKSLWKKVF